MRTRAPYGRCQFAHVWAGQAQEAVTKLLWKAGTGVSKKSDRRDWIRFSRQCNEMDEILTSESELRVDVLANYSHLRAGELARGPSDYLNVRCRVCAAPRRSGPARDVRIKETSIMGDP